MLVLVLFSVGEASDAAKVQAYAPVHTFDPLFGLFSSYSLSAVKSGLLPRYEIKISWQTSD